MRKLYSKLIFAVLVVFGLAQATVAVAQDPATPAKILLSYVYVDATTDGVLSLSLNEDLNPSIGPVTVSVKLTMHGMADVPAFQVTVPAFGPIRIPIKAHLPALTNAASSSPSWGNGSMASSAWGSISVSIPAGQDADNLIFVSAEIATIKSSAPPLAVSDTGRGGVSYVGSVVRRTTATTHVYEFIQDASGSSNTAYVSVNNGPFLAAVSIPANGNAMFDVTPYLTTGQVAEVEVNSSVGSPIVAAPLVVDETGGKATIAPALDVPDSLGTIFSQVFQVNGGWVNDIGIVNAGTATAHISAILYYNGATGPAGTLNGTTISVPANSGTVVSLASLFPSSTIPASATSASLMLTEILDPVYQPLTGVVFSSKGSLYLPWRFTDPSNGTSEKAAVGFALGVGADDTTALIAAVNMQNDPTDLMLDITYTDSSGVGHLYSSKTTTLTTGQSMLYDIRHLRDAQVQDYYGNVLPLNLIAGTAHLWSTQPDAILGSDTTYSAAAGLGLQCEDACGTGSQNGDEPNGKVNKVCLIFPKLPHASGGIQSQYYHKTGSLAEFVFFKVCPSTPQFPQSACGRLHPNVTGADEPPWVLGFKRLYGFVTFNDKTGCVSIGRDIDLTFDPCSTVPN